MQSQARLTVPLQNIALSEVISAFSYALDMTEGQPPGHCLRSCWIGMHIGKLLDMGDKDLWNLYYTLLLKDAGCSSNAARLCQLYGADDQTVKRDFKLVDSQHMFHLARFVFQHAGAGEAFSKRLKHWFTLALKGESLANELFSTRCERGADIALRLGFEQPVADGIRYLDEHWNGQGHPYQIKGDAIPLPSQIALLSQVIDVFFQAGGKSAVFEEIRNRAGSWFDPVLVMHAGALENNDAFWAMLGSDDIEAAIYKLEPSQYVITVDDEQLDRITEAFGLVVDAKSPYTQDHSARVAEYSLAIAREFGFDELRCRWLKRAAYLHDVGKLGVSNAILDKPGKLDDREWVEVRSHARFTFEILNRLTPFRSLSAIASAHHEKLNGQGYPNGLTAADLSVETRIITVADIFDAITAARPYRDAVPVDKTLAIMHKEVGTAIDAECFAALKKYIDR